MVDSEVKTDSWTSGSVLAKVNNLNHFGVSSRAERGMYDAMPQRIARDGGPSRAQTTYSRGGGRGRSGVCPLLVRCFDDDDY